METHNAAIKSFVPLNQLEHTLDVQQALLELWWRDDPGHQNRLFRPVETIEEQSKQFFTAINSIHEQIHRAEEHALLPEQAAQFRDAVEHIKFQIEHYHQSDSLRLDLHIDDRANPDLKAIIPMLRLEKPVLEKLIAFFLTKDFFYYEFYNLADSNQTKAKREKIAQIKKKEQDQAGACSNALILSKLPFRQLKRMPQADWLFAVWEMFVVYYPWPDSEDLEEHALCPFLGLSQVDRDALIQEERNQGIHLKRLRSWNLFSENPNSEHGRAIHAWVDEKIDRIGKVLVADSQSDEITLQNICIPDATHHWVIYGNPPRWWLYAALFERFLSNPPDWLKSLPSGSKSFIPGNLNQIQRLRLQELCECLILKDEMPNSFRINQGHSGDKFKDFWFMMDWPEYQAFRAASKSIGDFEEALAEERAIIVPNGEKIENVVFKKYKNTHSDEEIADKIRTLTVLPPNWMEPLRHMKREKNMAFIRRVLIFAEQNGVDWEDVSAYEIKLQALERPQYKYARTQVPVLLQTGVNKVRLGLCELAHGGVPDFLTEESEKEYLIQERDLIRGKEGVLTDIQWLHEPNYQVERQQIDAWIGKVRTWLKEASQQETRRTLEEIVLTEPPPLPGLYFKALWVNVVQEPLEWVFLDAQKQPIEELGLDDGSKLTLFAQIGAQQARLRELHKDKIPERLDEASCKNFGRMNALDQWQALTEWAFEKHFGNALNWIFALDGDDDKKVYPLWQGRPKNQRLQIIQELRESALSERNKWRNPNLGTWQQSEMEKVRLWMPWAREEFEINVGAEAGESIATVLGTSGANVMGGKALGTERVLLFADFIINPPACLKPWPTDAQTQIEVIPQNPKFIHTFAGQGESGEKATSPINKKMIYYNPDTQIVTYGNKPVFGAKVKRERAMFIALAKEHNIHRDNMKDYIWRRRSPENWIKELHDTATALRAAFNKAEAGLGDELFPDATDSVYRLNLNLEKIDILKIDN